MKFNRIIAAFLAVMCLSFAACSGEENKEPTTTDKVSGSTASENSETGDKTFSDIHGIVDSVKEFYGENVDFIFNEDEYSEDVLMFTYGFEDENLADAVDTFVVTECDGMSADTFAIVNFKAGTEKSLIDEAVSALETVYVEGLKSKLSAYNPEEHKAAEAYELKVYDDAIMLVISSKNTEAILSAVGK